MNRVFSSQIFALVASSLALALTLSSAPARADVDEPDAAASVGSAAAPVEKHRHKNDSSRTNFGGNTTIERDETVDELTVMGGNADIWGTVKGDLTVIGGSAALHTGSKVEGDVTAIGGAIEIGPGAVIDGEAHALGGAIIRSKTDPTDDDSVWSGSTSERKEDRSWVIPAAARSGLSFGSAALLFVFGVVLIALMPGRTAALQRQIVTQPMRTFALGVLGMVVAIAATIALCITLIGIPLAIFGMFGVILFGYAGVCGALMTLGAILLRTRTQNVYAHLAVGCLVWAICGAVPYGGGLFALVVWLVGAGAIVATRGMGAIPNRKSTDLERTV